MPALDSSSSGSGTFDTNATILETAISDCNSLRCGFTASVSRLFAISKQPSVLIHEVNRVFRAFSAITMLAKQLKIMLIITSSID